MTTRAALLSVAAHSSWLGPLWCAGCAGGMPLLHPAQVLGTGEVRASAGFSANVASVGFADALHDARTEAAATSTVPTDETYARGALVAASVAPGIAPFVSARVGIGAHAEGGIEYTGRAVRADVRKAFDLSRHWAVSVGAGASAALYGRSVDEPLPGVDLGQVHGWGGDVPVLVGYTSDGDLYAVWLGARSGAEYAEIGAVRSVPNVVTSGPSLTATRFWAGAVAGLAIGFRHVHLAMEIDLSYASVSGEFAGTHAQISGLAFVPASSVWWSF